jgi:CPA2 family monovalent cation:H+ antiporter-2
VEVETCRIDDDAPAAGKSLAELSLRPRTGASVIAWTRSQVTQSNPSETVRLQRGDVVTLLGSRDQIRRAMALLNEPHNGPSRPIK